ncbi:hypothetical protein R1flu_016406 [Riccia fluitans]|uniref:Uncharacterized protein n=1 Tax=Riccia fluitans TaxID=41844 RepID=A0ABD1YML5_9MARC
MNKLVVVCPRLSADLDSDMWFVITAVCLAASVIIEVLSSFEDEDDDVLENMQEAILGFENSASRVLLLCAQAAGGSVSTSSEPRWWVKERSLIWFDYYLWHSYDDERWVQTLRMPKRVFLYIVRTIAPRVSKQDTRFRKAVHVEVRCAAVIFKLATGQNYFHIGERFGMGSSTVQEMMHDVVLAINRELGGRFMCWPEGKQ